MFVSIFAHQGGWDEALMVVVPVGLFVVLLRAAGRRHEADSATTHDLEHDEADRHHGEARP